MAGSARGSAAQVARPGAGARSCDQRHVRMGGSVTPSGGESYGGLSLEVGASVRGQGGLTQGKRRRWPALRRVETQAHGRPRRWQASWGVERQSQVQGRPRRWQASWGAERQVHGLPRRWQASWGAERQVHGQAVGRLNHLPASQAGGQRRGGRPVVRQLVYRSNSGPYCRHQGRQLGERRSDKCRVVAERAFHGISGLMW